MGRRFGLGARWECLEAMADEPFDVLVIGGGITGAGVARDAALRGLRVALVEAGDFGGGTSSRSSRLLHGGLRYLRQGHVGLVWEAAHERTVLSGLAPGLVRPVTFLLPVYRGRGDGYRRTAVGLWIYRKMAGIRGGTRPRMVDARGALALEPSLRPEGLVGAGLFQDCAVDDARLVLLNVRGAWEAGARVANYCRAAGLLREDGRIRGAQVEDVLTGSGFTVRARTTVAAVGPWTDAFATSAGLRGPLLRPTQGVHLVLRPGALPLGHALALWNPEDGRLFFAIPWGERTIVGTTDTPFEGDPSSARASAADVDYLLRATNASLGDRSLTEEDVLSTYCGVRPLAWSARGGPGRIPREHRIVEAAPGLVVAYGGKLTTYRSMAEEVVDRVVRRIDGARRRSRTAVEPLQYPLGSSMEPQPGTPGGAVEHLAARHGGEALALARRAVAEGLDRPLSPNLPYLEVEVVEAAEEEMVVHLRDFMERRTHLALETPDHGVGIAPRVAALLAPALGWSPERIAAEVEDYTRAMEMREAWRQKGG